MNRRMSDLFPDCLKIAQSFASMRVYSIVCVFLFVLLVSYVRLWVQCALCVRVSVCESVLAVYVLAMFCLYMSAKWEVADLSYIYDTISV